MKTIYSHKSGSLNGEIIPPGDKSISHRAVILSSLACGTSYINNILNSEDVNMTISCMQQLGVIFNKTTTGYKVTSKGIQYITPKEYYEFYLGNSGTSARLLMGAVSNIKSTFYFNGDESLNKRPMLRIVEPLTLMGVNFNGNCTNLPFSFKGGGVKGINYNLKIGSAQVKSAILLAGLNSKDATIVTELIPSRDHTESMLKLNGVDVQVVQNKAEEKVVKTITLNKGDKTVKPMIWDVPGDFSSVSFFIVAALIVEGSHIMIKNVNLNPLRTGLLNLLVQLKANIKVNYKNKINGEDFGDIEVKYSKLEPFSVDSSLTSSLIDELPILFVLAAFTNHGEVSCKFYGIQELRYKESDRLSLMELNLNKLGVKTVSTNDSLEVYGGNNILKGGITVMSNLDHRIAMSFAVMGLKCESPLQIEGADVIKTSFPKFIEYMQHVGANIKNV